ncbi:MAG: type III-B CRISPR module RAMP protein Cmr6 [Thermofilaceae archaeon]|nr:type III-B CRISPR module RAMP protein Cmr6 [Thermofilaceae archaeon]
MGRSGPTQFRFEILEDYFNKIKKIEVTLNDVNVFSYVTLAGLLRSIKGADKGADFERMQLEKLCRMSKGDLSGVRRHLDVVREALLGNGYSVKRCRMVTAGRGIVGTGDAFGKILFEVGLSFDPILNVPYIPSSSLKGAFRSAIATKVKGDAEKAFGESGKVGLIGVTEAYPVNAQGRLLDPDVLTPHYPETEGIETELDVQPNPVVYAAIAPGVEFEFYIYYGKGILKTLNRQELKVSDKLTRDAHIFEGNLEEALKETKIDAEQLPVVDYAVIYALTRGLGAKTSAGYTRFKLIEYATVRE